MSNTLERHPDHVPIIVHLIGVILGFGLALGIPWINKRLEAKRYVEAGINLQYPNLIKHPELINRRTDLLEQAIAKYRKAIDLAPNWAEPHYYLADALDSQQMNELAIAEYRETIRLNPKFAPAYQELGNLLSTQGKKSEAIAAYVNAIRFDPAFVDPYVSLAGVLEDQGKIDEAIAYYRQATQLDLDHPYSGGYNREYLYFYLGQALEKKNSLTEAIEAYISAIRIDPTCSRDYDAWNLVSACNSFYESLQPLLKKQNKSGKPIAEIVAANVLHPDAKTYLEIATFYEQEGKQNLANSMYARAIWFNPENAQAYLDLGNVLTAYSSEKKQFREKAIVAYREAIRLDPNQEQAHYQLAINLELQGKLNDAIAQYQEVLRINPNNIFAHKDLGVILYKQGNLAAAEKQLRIAKNLFQSEQNKLADASRNVQEIENVEQILKDIERSLL